MTKFPGGRATHGSGPGPFAPRVEDSPEGEQGFALPASKSGMVPGGLGLHNSTAYN